MYSFIARDENDVSVERGDFVTVLNREDPDWYWIVRSDGLEGFVPSGFVYPADVLQSKYLDSLLNFVPIHLYSNFFFLEMTSNLAASSSNNTNNGNSSSNPTSGLVSANPVSNFNEEMRFHGTELVMLYDYKVKDLLFLKIVLGT